jgi:hypothetical protein
MKRTGRTTTSTVGALIAGLGLPAGTAHADDSTPRTGLPALVVTPDS